MNLQPGTRLGKYTLIRRIAVGGMAELYLASTQGIEGFEKLIAIKRILPHFAETDELTRMFLDEARLAASLNHQNIAQVNDIGVEDGCHFIVMEYVHGVDLQKLLRAGRRRHKPLPLECAVTIASQIAAGLHYAHEKAGPDGISMGLVHRDVSPHNVIVSYDGSVKLVDFGIAKATNKAQQTTATGSLKGKLAYMSPEQATGKGKLDRRTDIFSLGIVIWELTTGRRLFGEENSYEQVRLIVESDAPSPRSVFPEYPPALEAVVLRALERQPKKRYQTAQALQAALEDFAHEYRLRLTSATLSRYMEELFGEKLDEWRSARAQGQQFVEDHVVKTLDGLQHQLAETEQFEKVVVVDELEDEEATDVESINRLIASGPDSSAAGSPSDAPFQRLPSFNLGQVSLTGYPTAQPPARPRREIQSTARVVTLPGVRRRRRRRLWLTIALGLIGGLLAAVVLWSDGGVDRAGEAQPAASDGVERPGETSPETDDDRAGPLSDEPGNDEVAGEVGEGRAGEIDEVAGDELAGNESGETVEEPSEPVATGKRATEASSNKRKKRRKRVRRKRPGGANDSGKKPSWNSSSPLLPDR